MIVEGWIVLMCLQSEGGQASGPSPASKERSWIQEFRGTLSIRYRSRWTPDDRDEDLYEFLTLGYGDSERDPVTFSASARFSEDLDGRTDESGHSAFDSVDDTYESGETGRLYTAFLDVSRIVGWARLRAGRQWLEEIPEAGAMDGGKVELRFAEPVSLTLFAGRPVNWFESSRSGDAMYGGRLEVVPWERGKVRVEYLHLKDENTFDRYSDDLLGIALEQRLGPVRLDGRYTNLEEESRDLTLGLAASVNEIGLLAQVRWTHLYQRQVAHSYPLDPYAVLMLDLQPYDQFLVSASKTLGEVLSVDASVTFRDLREESDEGTYNHEFTRWNMTPRLAAWPWKGVSIAVPVDFWQSTGDDFWTVGGDVSWAADRLLTLGAGSSYSLYEIDGLTGEERERVRSVYGTIRWKAPGDFVVDLRLSVERNEFDSYSTFQIGVRRAF